jgi:hypothetical protein
MEHNRGKNASTGREVPKRIGEHRIFYDVTDQAVEILAIVSKSEAESWLRKLERDA